ncbi:MAG TPA: hypothetical protein VKW08_07475 [Xanthobacteraceae bacterium]|nr:hypothetical protein [Xanthobacteraceae bacterium]
MTVIMRLYEDVLANAAGSRLRLPPLPRMIFVVHGTATIEGRSFSDGEAWSGEEGVSLSPGGAGLTCWRFELAATGAADAAEEGAVSSRLKLAAAVETLPPGELLLRGDSVAFPPGGCAYLHRHQGPGIRCLIEGGIRIDTHGASTSYGPGGAWYESGPEPVFAQAAADRATRFIRMMILPRALIGKSSIAYLKAEDKERPKSQSYKGYADLPIRFTRPYH